MLCTKQYSFHCPSTLVRRAQREAAELLVVPQVAEHRFDRGEVRVDHPLAQVPIDALLHPVGVGFVTAALAAEEGELSHPGPVRGAQTLMSLFAQHAVALSARVFRGGIAIDRAVPTVAIEPLARRADAGAAVLGLREIGVGVGLRLAALVPQRVRLRFVLRLFGVALIAWPVAVVANSGRGVSCGKFGQVPLRVVAGVGAAHGRNGGLVRRIDRGHIGIALDHAFAGGHVGRVVVGAVTQPHSALGAAPLVRVAREPVADLRCFVGKTVAGARRTRLIIIVPCGIAWLLLADLGLDRRFHLRGLVAQLGNEGSNRTRSQKSVAVREQHDLEQHRQIKGQGVVGAAGTEG
jgi:hypothetical protein